MLWYSLEVPHQIISNMYHNICFCCEIREKYQYLLVEMKKSALLYARLKNGTCYVTGYGVRP